MLNTLFYINWILHKFGHNLGYDLKIERKIMKENKIEIV